MVFRKSNCLILYPNKFAPRFLFSKRGDLGKKRIRKNPKKRTKIETF